MSTNRAPILTLSCLLIVGTSSPAWAWGRLGHRVSASLAERHLSDSARAGISEPLPGLREERRHPADLLAERPRLLGR